MADVLQRHRRDGQTAGGRRCSVGREMSRESVLWAPHYRLYAGFLLRDGDGHPIGTLRCRAYGSRAAKDDQVAALQDRGQLVVDTLEMRLIATSDTLTGHDQARLP